MVSIYQGDIFEAPVDVIIHQANCFNTMGAGIAKAIRKRYPRAYEVDQLTKRGDINKLSQFTFAAPNTDQDKWIVNLYGQYHYGRDRRYTNYIAVATGLRNIQSWLKKMGLQGKTIGIPYGMGCMNAGGDWSIVEGLIREVFEKTKFKVLICKI